MMVSILENSSEVNNIILLSHYLIESNVILEFLWYHPPKKGKLKIFGRVL